MRQAQPDATTEPKRNIADPQSQMLPLRGGSWLQGYNCRAVTSSDRLIIATSVGNKPSDAVWLPIPFTHPRVDLIALQMSTR